MIGIALVLGALLIVSTSFAEYTFGLSQIGTLDGVDPVVELTQYPGDSTAVDSEIELEFTLADQVATELSVEVFLRDTLWEDESLLASQLATGSHTYSTELEVGAYSLGVRAQDDYGISGEAVGGTFIVFGTGVTFVQPASFALERIAPNPFNPLTTIYFSLRQPGPISLIVYNVYGQKVTSLIDGWMAAGRYSILFDGTTLSSGLYLARLVFASGVRVAKLSLLK
jgi:hypothetical protein